MRTPIHINYAAPVTRRDLTPTQMLELASAAAAIHNYDLAQAWLDAAGAATEGPKERHWKMYSVAEALQRESEGLARGQRYVRPGERAAIRREREG